jgi:hemoglobin
MQEHEIYTAIGEAGFERIVASFYRAIPNDDILGPMYPADDLVGAEQRLRDFLVGRFGGPPRYIQERGHPRLRMRHMPFPVHQDARNRWMLLMSNALDEAKIDPDADQILREFFSAMSSFLINHPQ